MDYNVKSLVLLDELKAPSYKADPNMIKDMELRLERIQTGEFVKTDAHEVALRQLMFSKIAREGKDMSQFIELMTGNKNLNGDVTKIAKRFSFFHTPNFKKINYAISRAAANNQRDSDIVASFANRGTARVAIWNDKGYEGMDAPDVGERNGASIKDEMKRMYFTDENGKAKENFGMTFDTYWNDVLHARGDESAFDSIAYWYWKIL